LLRTALAYVGLLALCGCYHPNAAVGAPCGPGGACPDGQQCDLSQQPPTCVLSLGGPTGDAGGDALADSAIDASTLPFDASTATCGGQVCSGTKPVCSNGACRGCSADAECPSNACYEQMGTCVDESTVVYIAPMGSDTGACTAAAPCATLSFAVTIASAARPMIRVAPGAYNDAVLVTSLAFPLLISGPSSSPGTATFTFASPDGSKDHLIELRAGTTEIEGLTFEGGKQEVTRVQGQPPNSVVSMTLERCKLTGGKGGVDDSSAAVVMRHLVVDTTGGIGVHVAGTGATLDSERSTITNNPQVGISISGATFKVINTLIANNAGGGLSASGTITGSTVEFDTFAGNAAGSGASVPPAGGAVSSGNALAVVDSIFAVNGAPQLGVDVSATYSLFSDTNPGGSGDLVGAPLFVDGSGGNYHLQTGSPAVDVGIDVGVDNDLDANPRPQGSGFDLGCYELAP
jgi:hypothetical protein